MNNTLEQILTDLEDARIPVNLALLPNSGWLIKVGFMSATGVGVGLIDAAIVKLVRDNYPDSDFAKKYAS